MPEELRKKGGKVRIKNAATGQAKVIEVKDQEFISSDEVRDLMDPKTKVFKPEFAILGTEKRRKPLSNRRLKPGTEMLTNSLVFDQPVWRELSFKSLRTRSGAIVFRLEGDTGRVLPGVRAYVDSPGATVVTSVPLPTPEEAARRRSLMEGGDSRKLFDIGWRSLAAKRYDLGLIAFSKLVARKEYLSAEEVTQAHLGRALSRFNQEGCGKVEEDFRVAERNPKNFDDVTYYRGLCAVEQKNFPAANAHFKALSNKSGSKYEESSRFFLGVVAENEDRLEDAESAYLDTIDFAKDAGLVNLAKTRLENVRRAKEARDYARRWLTAAFTGGLGYDTNVVALPRSLAPADYSLKGKSSPTMLGLMYTEIRPPWTRAIDLKFKYTLLNLRYLSTEISKNYNILSHEVGVGIGFTPSERDRITMDIAYNSIFKTTSGTLGEFMATPSFAVGWQGIFGPLEAPTSDMAVDLKVGLARPRVSAAAPSYDASANSYALTNRYNMREASGDVWGPGLDFEYHPAVGSEISYYSATALAKWDQPVGPEDWGLYSSQELSFQYVPYYQSSASRKDKLVKYTGSVAHMWWGVLETRLQYIGTMSFSSVPANYRYNKGQFNLLLSAVF